MMGIWSMNLRKLIVEEIRPGNQFLSRRDILSVAHEYRNFIPCRRYGL
jgi:hypothetical protein